MPVVLAIAALPGVDRILAEHGRALPQEDQLCGPFWARLALLADRRDPSGLPGMAAVARSARTAIWLNDDLNVRPPEEPAFIRSWEQLRKAARPEEAGTSAAGVVEAIEVHSGGRLAAVPVTGSWNTHALLELLGEVADLALVILANVRTGALWGSHPSEAALEAFLRDGDSRVGPACDWDVGHWLGIWGVARSERAVLVAVADTYRSLGDNGRHLQPVDRVAAALARDRPHTGGLVVVIAPADRDRVVRVATKAGLDIRTWVN